MIIVFSLSFLTKEKITRTIPKLLLPLQTELTTGKGTNSQIFFLLFYVIFASIILVEIIRYLISVASLEASV